MPATAEPYCEARDIVAGFGSETNFHPAVRQLLENNRNFSLIYIDQMAHQAAIRRGIQTGLCDVRLGNRGMDQAVAHGNRW